MSENLGATYKSLGPLQSGSMFYDVKEFKCNRKTKLRVESDWMDFKNEKPYWTDKSKIFYTYLDSLENEKELVDSNDSDYKYIIVNYE